MTMFNKEIRHMNFGDMHSFSELYDYAKNHGYTYSELNYLLGKRLLSSYNNEEFNFWCWLIDLDIKEF